MSSTAPFDFTCPFGYVGVVEPVSPLPTTKAAFASVLAEDILAAQRLTRGFIGYQTEINSRVYHVFDTRFLLRENNAVVITVGQLDRIVAHLQAVQTLLAGVADGAIVPADFVDQFNYVRPWIQRVRQVLIGCHIFYKINFRLCSN